MTQARIVSTASGARWLAEGWRLFRAAPVGWFAVVFLYFLFTHVAILVPLVGIAAILLVPVFTVGLYAVARALTRGQAPEVGMLFSGFRSQLRPQLLLGAAYAASVLAVVAAMRVADSEGILQTAITDASKEPIERAELLAALAGFALFYTPVAMLFWFAAPLVAWHSTGVMKALFFSFIACWMNWRAFLGYAAAVGAILVGFALVVRIVALFEPGPAAISYFAVSFVILLMPTLFASFYASYRDIFGEP